MCCFPPGSKKRHTLKDVFVSGAIKCSLSLFFFFFLGSNVFHIVSLNGVDSGNAVTPPCFPNFQSEVWPAWMAALWTPAPGPCRVSSRGGSPCWCCGAVKWLKLCRETAVDILCFRSKFICFFCRPELYSLVLCYLNVMCVMCICDSVPVLYVCAVSLC